MGNKKHKMGYGNISIEKLIKASWNYKIEDKDKQEKLKQNIKKNGQIENILVREVASDVFEVVNGNHRLNVLKDLNISAAYCYNLGKISQNKAIRIAIETNETKFGVDSITLAQRIKEISSEFDISDLTTTLPYNEQELENMKSLIDFDWEQYNTIDIKEKEKWDKTLNVKMTEDTYKLWLELKDRFQNILGYDNDSKVFEFMIAETLSIPLESYK